jgi:uncharacterized damage-inducible protein DinB
MTELERTANYLRETFTGDAWHGDPMKKILVGVSHEGAAAHPIADAHSIWELVLHITAWLEMFERTLHGTPLPQHNVPGYDEMNFPPVRATGAKAWKEAQEHMYAAAEKMAAGIALFDAAKMTAKVPGRDYDFGYALPGIVAHSIYHAGQIAILKKAFSGQPSAVSKS